MDYGLKRKRIFKFSSAVIGLLVCCLSLGGRADIHQVDEIKQAISHIKTIVHWPGEDEVSPLISAYEQADLDQYNEQEKARYLLKKLSMHQWGNKITEFINMVELLFSFETDEYQTAKRPAFQKALHTLTQFRISINDLVTQYHPGFDLEFQQLASDFQGSGIVIAVIDVFESALLEQQRAHYPQAHIETLQSFGNPVALNHGNSVIDVILTIAPQAKVVPISAEAKTYNQAMTYLLTRDDVLIVNMSRGFAEKEGELDAQFAALLKRALMSKIVIKSLGNTGTDLDGNITPLRQRLGLSDTGNLFAYDLQLIKTFTTLIEHENYANNLLFAINLNTFADDIALSATIPGENPIVANQSFGIPAEAVYTWATDNYESGSSFAAPQLTAITALLLQAYQQSTGQSAQNVGRIVDTLKQSARISVLDSTQTGIGLVNGDKALSFLGYNPGVM
ncbi:S8/S53 family peptidase [Zooshikella harenae]|uniref:S8/S53 family peptidase n=1 Tax=Zooshikella harenae TaxID=2827238 RepID=A0ABS5ZAV6_9GAMM|nr:S8/S53 family peptidase [Zooshikella harenae]MBU2711197.1 S8/S53 family peptidase [Zooshikella harenae]